MTIYYPCQCTYTQFLGYCSAAEAKGEECEFDYSPSHFDEYPNEVCDACYELMMTEKRRQDEEEQQVWQEKRQDADDAQAEDWERTLREAWELHDYVAAIEEEEEEDCLFRTRHGVT
jgi:ribosome-binding protein aMBF1 (putative translation factor)